MKWANALKVFKNNLLVIFCFLFSSVDYVPVKGEIIWYLSLTAWLISLNIMLEVKNNLTMDRGEWGGDSEERGLQELL